MDKIRKTPVTWFLVGSSLALTLPVVFHILRLYNVVFILGKLLNFEVWRLPTSFLFGGNGIQFLVDTLILYRNSYALESTRYNRRPLKYASHLLLCCSGITLLNLPLNTFVHYRPFLVCITYLASRLSSNTPVSVLGIPPIKALYFPFILIAADLFTGGISAAAISLTGVIVGHAWWLMT